MAFLEGSVTTTPSRTLGDARFYSIVTGAGVIEDVAWSYETPLAAAERIAGSSPSTAAGWRSKAPDRPSRGCGVLDVELDA